jgi:hypothetical protein
MTALTPITPPPSDDDGFHHSSTSDRGGKFLKWTDAIGWVDNDGNKPPSPLMAWKLREFTGQWKDHQLLREPISRLEELNAAIPEADWPFNEQSGKKEPPWKRFVRIDFVDPATGRRYRYEHHTTGAQIMWEDLRDDVVNMRLLRGDPSCLPIVNLTECPWPLARGMRKRPVAKILGYKTPGGGDGQAIAAKPPPQLSGPTTAAQAPPPPMTPPPAPSVTPAAASNPAKPKPPVQLTGETLEAMGDVKPVTTSEIMNDELNW